MEGMRPPRASPQAKLGATNVIVFMPKTTKAMFARVSCVLPSRTGSVPTVPKCGPTNSTNLHEAVLVVLGNFGGFICLYSPSFWLGQLLPHSFQGRCGNKSRFAYFNPFSFASSSSREKPSAVTAPLELRRTSHGRGSTCPIHLVADVLSISRPNGKGSG